MAADLAARKRAQRAVSGAIVKGRAFAGRPPASSRVRIARCRSLRRLATVAPFVLRRGLDAAFEAPGS
eukprot:8960958-Lingulodinium_polyedra.AAC.1